MPNADAPTAGVPNVGLSEVVLVLTIIGSALTSLFGRDWGVTANAQQYAGAAVVFLPAALAFARAIKHHGASHANAVVAAAQLTVAAPAPVDAGSAGQGDPYPGDPVPTAPVIQATLPTPEPSPGV